MLSPVKVPRFGSTIRCLAPFAIPLPLLHPASAVSADYPSLSTIAGIALLLGWLWLIKRGFDGEIGTLEKLQSEARSVLAQYTALDTQESHTLIGAEAEVVSREEHVKFFNQSVIVDYGLTLLLRNRHGEYFLFIHRHKKKPYVKHTPRALAFAKLKARGITPPVDG